MLTRPASSAWFGEAIPQPKPTAGLTSERSCPTTPLDIKVRRPQRRVVADLGSRDHLTKGLGSAYFFFLKILVSRPTSELPGTFFLAEVFFLAGVLQC